MSIPKKGARTITVGGEIYHWRIRHRPPYCQSQAWTNMNIAIEQGQKMGAVLMVELAQSHPSIWIGKPSKPVKPADIESFILEAIHRGWKPKEKGSAFRLLTETPYYNIKPNDK